MSKNDVMFDEIPALSGKEFAYIRRRCGITQAQFAKNIGFCSRSAIWAWEQKDVVEPYQVKMLMTMAQPDVFKAACRMYKDMNKNAQSPTDSIPD